MALLKPDTSTRYSVLGILYALAIVTPFCGWAFACGCDWPWRGLAEHCNYFDPRSEAQCPWCLYSPVGAVAVAGAALLGAYIGGRVYRLALVISRLIVVTAVPVSFLLVWAGLTRLVT